jgi:SAM-dependent methyltransferase
MTSTLSHFKRLARAIVPKPLLERRRRRITRQSISRVDQELVGKAASEIFSEIYRRQLWGRPTGDRRFSSGHGSSMGIHVEPYVVAVGKLLAEFAPKPSVADLGCGDFNIGSQIRQHFGRYIACDVATEVLEENRDRYSSLDVEFRKLDMINDEYPDADVCIIRQVLQHLSNADISRVVGQLHRYQVLILTEPLPKTDFTPNLDQPTGVSSRLARGIPSGVVLTEPPFSLVVKSSRVLCATMDDLSFARLVTTAYWLR